MGNNEWEDLENSKMFLKRLVSMQKQEMVQKAIAENKSLIPSIKYDGYIKEEFERLLKQNAE